MRLPLKSLCDVFWRWKDHCPNSALNLYGFIQLCCKDSLHFRALVHLAVFPLLTWLPEALLSRRLSWPPGLSSSNSLPCVLAPKHLQQWLRHTGLPPRAAKVLARAPVGNCSIALTNRRCSPSLTVGCAAAKGVAALLSKSWQLYPVAVTKSRKLLKPCRDSSDRGKNLLNNMYNHTRLKENFCLVLC